MAEAIGYVPFWGFTPAINFFQGTELSLDKDEEINVLISECADLRHVLKTLAESLPLNQTRQKPLNIFFHEKYKENLCRGILFLTIICECQLAERERQELFLDLYGNALLRDKTQNYLESTVNELIQLITDDDRCKSVLKEIISLQYLEYEGRDEMEDVFKTYLKRVPFDIEKLRDQRLRHHFAERYDFRKNAMDWDFNFFLRDKIPHLNSTEYKDWRMNGIAFETRLTSNTVPNRTLSSYIPGKKKKSGDSIMVRGFWGDIINSPYITFGTEVVDDSDKDKFFKKVNFQRIYMASDISAYNVQAYIHKLEKLSKYEYPFERLKHIEKQYEKVDSDPNEEEKKDEEEKKELEQIEEVDEEQKDEDQSQIDTTVAQNQPVDKVQPDNDEEQIDTNSQAKEMLKKLQAPQKKIDLSQIEEEVKSSQTQPSEGATRQLLEGFKQANIKFYMMSDNIDKLYNKKKFRNFFDIGVLSIHSANNIKKEMSCLFKDQAKVHVESGDYLVIFRPEQKEQYRLKLREMAKEAKWTLQKEDPTDHHILLTVHQIDENQSEISTRPSTAQLMDSLTI